MINNQEVDTLVHSLQLNIGLLAKSLFTRRTHTLKPKKMGLSSVYSLLINVVAPMLFCYGEHKQVEELKERR